MSRRRCRSRTAPGHLHREHSPDRPKLPRPPLFVAMGLTVSMRFGPWRPSFSSGSTRGCGAGAARRLCDMAMAVAPVYGPRRANSTRAEPAQRPHQVLATATLSAGGTQRRSAAESFRAVLDGPQKSAGRVDPDNLKPTDEGKTTLAVSLAVYGPDGQRVLLLDLDLRHPSVLREVLHIEWLTGIVERLRNEFPLELMIDHDPEFHLDVISVRERPTDPMSCYRSAHGRASTLSARHLCSRLTSVGVRPARRYPRLSMRSCSPRWS